MKLENYLELIKVKKNKAREWDGELHAVLPPVPKDAEHAKEILADFSDGTFDPIKVVLDLRAQMKLSATQGSKKLNESEAEAQAFLDETWNQGKPEYGKPQLSKEEKIAKDVKKLSPEELEALKKLLAEM